MSLDAIIIADYGKDTFSSVSSFRFHIDGELALIQNIINYISNNGKIVHPVDGDKVMSWAASPKLNGIYLFSYLTEKKLNVRLINSYFDERDIFTGLLSDSPKFIIISTTFINNKKHLKDLIDDIRGLAPDIYIIIGGTFVYNSYLLKKREADRDYDTDSPKRDYLFLDRENDPAADLYIISLRGEDILCEVIDSIKKGGSIDGISNLAEYKNGEYFFKKINDDISTESLNINWDLLPQSMYAAGVMPLQASNGCPNNCAFCNFVKDRRLFYTSPIEKTISELKSISEKGIRYVRFVDDNFRLGKRDLEIFCKKLVEAELPIKWSSFIAAGVLKDMDFDLLHRSGFIEAQIGIESAHPDILKNMNKKADPGLYAAVIKNLLKYGIDCSCCFIFGFPGETKETLAHTRDFILSIECPDFPGVLYWNFFPFILAPLSPIYEKQNRLKYDLTGYMQNWNHITMNSGQVKEEIYKTFSAIDNSSPITSGDNLEMLYSLQPEKRNAFISNRHQLAKKSLTQKISKNDIDSSFRPVIASLLVKK